MHLFLNELRESVKYLHDFSRKTVSEADVIVMELCKGEPLICTPELFYRKKSIIIGIMNDPSPIRRTLPNCISDIVFLDRGASLEKIRKIIIRLWNQRKTLDKNAGQSSCFQCNHETMTARQMKIMTNIISGLSVSQIASEMEVNDKNIYNYKYTVMNKFNLNNNLELIAFLKCLSSKKHYAKCFTKLDE